MQKLEEQFFASGGKIQKFKLGNLFTFSSIKQSKSQKNIPVDNSIDGVNYIIQSMFNNMFSRKVNRQYLIENDEVPISGNKIVLGVTLPAVSYQPEEFGASQVIVAEADWLNSKNGLFIVASIEKLMYLFSYSNKPGLKIYKSMEVDLPATKDNQLDFAYMEKFITELQAERLQELQGYLQITGLSNYTLTDEELHLIDKFDSIEWMSFDITNVFNVNNTHSILSSWITPNSGGIPYVTAGESNNSISTYIDYDISQIEKGNSIMIGGKTLVITYQESDYFSNDSHNLALYAKDEQGKLKDNQFFMISSLYKSLKPRYSWGDSISKKKIQLDTFDLPVKNGLIDYEFMSKWIQIIKKLVIADVVKYADRELSAYQSVIGK